jgi:hypothetical protein
MPLLVAFVVACGMAGAAALALERVLPPHVNGVRPPESHALRAYEAA